MKERKYKIRDFLRFLPWDWFRMTPKQRTGRRTEAYAAKFLRREKGFRIVTRNCRLGRDEVDIVAWDGAALVFVEVRARSEDALVPGFHSVGAAKKHALRRAIRSYLGQMREKPRHHRFDIVEVRIGKKQTFDVNHYENVSL